MILINTYYVSLIGFVFYIHSNKILIFFLRDPYDSRNVQTVRDYDTKINQVKLPYDNLRQLYLEYDNFNSQQNGETWAPYLNYPLGKRLTYAEKKILYDSYSSVTYSYFWHVKVYDHFQKLS